MKKEILTLGLVLVISLPAAGAGEGLGAPSADPDFSAYITNVQNIVGTQWRTERRRYASGGGIEMAFKVRRNGQIFDVHVQKSSGNPKLDELAGKIISSSYLPALPAGSPDTVDVQLTLAFSPDLAVEEQQLKAKVDSEKSLDAMSAYAKVLQEENKSKEAIDVLKQALTLAKGSTIERANLLNQLARLYGLTNQNTAALPLLQERLSIIQALPKATNDELAGATEDVAVCLQNLKRKVPAQEMFNRALELRLKNPSSKSLSSLIDKMDAVEGSGSTVRRERLHELHQGILSRIEKSSASNQSKAIALKTVARHCLNHLDPDSCIHALLAAEALEPSLASDDSVQTLKAQGLYLSHKTAEALPLLQSALEQREKRIGVEARDVREHRDTLAACYVKLGETGKAEQLYLSALKQAEQGGNKELTAKAYRDLAQYYAELKIPDLTKAEDAQLHHLLLTEELKGPLAPDTVRARDQLAGMYLQERRKDFATALYQRAVGLCTASEADKSNALTHLAAINAATQNPAEAERILKSMPPETDPVLEKYRLYNLARVSGFLDRRDDQEKYLKQLVEFCNKQPDDHDHLLGQAILASHYWKRGDFASAAPEIEKEYQLSQRLESPDRLISKVERERIARFYLAAGKLDQAETMLKADLDPNSHPNNATISVNSILLSRLYEKQGKKEQAETILAEALKRLPSSDHPAILCTLASLYSSHGKPREAINLLQKEIPLQASGQRRDALNFCLAKAYMLAGDKRSAQDIANKVLDSLKNPPPDSVSTDERILFLPVTASADTKEQANIPTSVVTGEVVRTHKSKNGNGCFEVYYLDNDEYGAPNKRLAKVVRRHFADAEHTSELVFFPEGTEDSHTVEAAQQLVKELLKQCDKEH